MKRINVLAASLIAVTLVTLSLVPLTRDALRFDMQMAGGRSVLGGTLVSLGIKQSDLPFGGAGPALSGSTDTTAAISSDIGVRIANSMALPSPEKWLTFQKLVAECPESAAAHAALVRIACKNGGTVGVGHLEDQEMLLASPSLTNQSKSQTRSEGDPEDAAIMLRSCEAGERLDPDNAYFPAMAAVALYAQGHDNEAKAALHRAVGKPRWHEYFDSEAAGRVRRAELLQGPQNSLTESSHYASMLFPHYTALRSMGRVVTAQAMQAEQAEDFKTGLVLRRDIALLGEKMRDQSSSLIGGLVGLAMLRGAEARPGGAPALKTDDTSGAKQLDASFLAYLRAHGQQVEAVQWQARLTAGDATRAIVTKGTQVSALSSDMLLQTQARLLTSLALLGGLAFFCVLGGLALMQPRLERRATPAALALAVVGFFGLMSWSAWRGLGNLRDIMAFGAVIQGLSGTESDVTQSQQLAKAISNEAILGGMAILLPLLYLGIIAILARLRRVSYGMLLRRYTLSVAALLTLIYTVHLTAFALRERVVRTELQQVLHHEGRYLAKKLGTVWPTSPAP